MPINMTLSYATKLLYISSELNFSPSTSEQCLHFATVIRLHSVWIAKSEEKNMFRCILTVLIVEAMLEENCFFAHCIPLIQQHVIL